MSKIINKCWVCNSYLNNSVVDGLQSCVCDVKYNLAYSENIIVNAFFEYNNYILFVHDYEKINYTITTYIDERSCSTLSFNILKDNMSYEIIISELDKQLKLLVLK